MRPRLKDEKEVFFKITLSRKGWMWIGLLITVYFALAWSGVYVFSGRDVAILLICFACELLDSSVGMGYGTTLTPLLLLMGFDPLKFVPTILMSELLSGFAAAFFHAEAGNVQFVRRSAHLRAAFILSAGSLAGVLVGVHLSLSLSPSTLTALIGGIILLAGIYLCIHANHVFPYRSWKMLFLAVVASFNKSISGGGYGPLMTSGQVLSGVESRAAVAITSLAEGLTCLLSVLLFSGQGRFPDINLLIPVCVGSLLSVPFSAAIVRKVDEKRMKSVVAYVTILFGVIILLKVAGGI